MKDKDKMQRLAEMHKTGLVEIGDGASAETSLKVKVLPLKFGRAAQFIEVMARLGSSVAGVIGLVEVIEKHIQSLGDEIKFDLSTFDAKRVSEALKGLHPEALNDAMALLNEHVDIDLNHEAVTHDIVPPLLVEFINLSFNKRSLGRWGELGNAVMGAMPEGPTAKPTTRALVEAGN